MKKSCLACFSLLFSMLVSAADFSGDYSAHHVGTLIVTGTAAGTSTETIDRADAFSVRADGSIVSDSGEVRGSVAPDGTFNGQVVNVRSAPNGQSITGQCSVVGQLVESGGNVSGGGSYSCSFSDPRVSESGTWTARRIAAVIPPPTTPVTQPVPLPDPATLTVGNGIIPVENIAVSAAGSIARLTLQADLKVADIFVGTLTARFAAAGYKVYVAALVPGQQVARPQAVSVFFGKASDGRWSEVAGPLPAFMENVAVSSQDSRVRIEILRDTDLSTLVGTEFYIGYGTSDGEMIANRRYRGIYKVQ